MAGFPPPRMYFPPPESRDSGRSVPPRSTRSSEQRNQQLSPVPLPYLKAFSANLPVPMRTPDPHLHPLSERVLPDSHCTSPVHVCSPPVPSAPRQSSAHRPIPGVRSRKKFLSEFPGFQSHTQQSEAPLPPADGFSFEKHPRTPDIKTTPPAQSHNLT